MIEIEECGPFLGSLNLAWKHFRRGLNLTARWVRLGVIGKSRGWGWLNWGLVWHNCESGAAVDEDADENMSSIFHTGHLQMSCGICRNFEPCSGEGWMTRLLPVLSTGFYLGLAGKS